MNESNELRPIDTPDAAQKFVTAFDWEDAFLREACLTSPSFVTETGGIANFASPPDLRLEIHLPSATAAKIEVVFDEVDTFELPITCELDPVVQFQGNRVVLLLNGDVDRRIRALHARFRVLPQ